MATPNVFIAGAGIAGTTLALQLSRIGVPVQIIDTVTNFQPIGAGINLLPHATGALNSLGLLEALESSSAEIERLSFKTASGQLIHSEARGRNAGYHDPQLAIHRGTLHEILLKALEQSQGIEMRQGEHLVGFRSGKENVEITLANVSTGIEAVTHVNALIGCDGIHSKVRECLYPEEGNPVQSGVEMWRGIAMNSGLQLGREMSLIGCLRDLKLVLYPLGSQDGAERVNWVLERRQRAEAMATADWSRIADKAALRDICQQSEIECVDLGNLINSTETVHYYQMVDRDPLPQWSYGRVTLLGDAAHPMYPFGSNGACQAILDTKCLSSEMAEASTVMDAFESYDAKRRPAMSKVVELNRELPPDAILDIVDERLGKQVGAVPSDVIGENEIARLSERYKAVAGFSLSQV